MEDDGTTRQIRRTYINKGLLLETNETKNNGALLLKTLVYLNDVPVPNPPTGYTLVSTRVENPNGLETTTYVFAKGNGQTDQSDEVKNNGALLIRTIRYLTASSVSTNPITTPTGYTNISYGYSDQDGYRVWTASYAKGNGQVSQEDEVKNNGTLLIRAIRYLTDSSVSTNPITTPTGYVNFSYGYSDQDGHRLWSASYAKGNGKLSQTDEVKFSGAFLRTTIIWLTASSVTTQPTTDPLSGGTIISTSYEDRDGYRIWTVVWSKGVATNNVIESVEYKNNGKLVVYTRQKLGGAPTAPTATIGGTVVLIESTTKLEDGYTLYSSTWAEGYGLVIDSNERHNQNLLIIYRRTSIGVAPTTPTNIAGGVVTLISSSSREESGVTIYDYSWAEGRGVYEKRIQMRDGGLRIETWISYGVSYDASFMLPIGSVMAIDNEKLDGTTRWTVSCMQKANGQDPTTGTALNYNAKRLFTYPGRAKAVATTGVILGYTRTSYDIFQSPPVEAVIDANIQVTYQTSNTLPTLSYPIWNPTEWAAIRAFYMSWQQYPKFVTIPLPKYRAVSDTVLTFNGGSVDGYRETCMGDRVYGIGSGTPYSLTVSGGPSAPDGNTYTIEPPLIEPAFQSSDGYTYYRVTIVTATIPAQPALPV
jgi:hypothetical protein